MPIIRRKRSSLPKRPREAPALPTPQYNFLGKLFYGLPITDEEWRETLASATFVQAIRLRIDYKWPWSAGAEYLYRHYLRAVGLQSREEELVRLARPKPGRKQELELFLRIVKLKSGGKTAREIRAVLEREGRALSKEGVESYLKTRRRKKQP